MASDQIISSIQCLLVRYSDNTYGIKYASVIEDDTYPMSIFHSPKFYLDGRLRRNNMIMSFDLTSNEFTELYLPDSLSDYYETSFKITKIKESLVVLEWKYMAAKRVYGVWMMENGNPKSFTKLYTIDSPDGSSIREVHGFSKSGKPIIVTKKYSYEPDSLSVYEPYTKDINTIGIPGKRGIRFAISYMETLVLLDH
ncbi:putative F-box domain-containing protein [Tanacetum coccineum]